MRSLALILCALCAGLPTVATASMRPVQTISGRQIEALADRNMRSVKLDGNHSYALESSIPDQELPIGHVSLEAGSPLVTPSFVNVPVNIAVDGTFNRAIFVGYRIQAWVQQAVAARDIPPGTVLQAGDVTMARVPFIGRLQNGTQVLVGRRTIAAVVSGQPIYIESTSADQIVKPGATVILIIRDGGVAVMSDVIARTGGGLGDMVLLYNPVTNKQLSGIVTGPGRVELQISGGDDSQ